MYLTPEQHPHTAILSAETVKLGTQFPMDSARAHVLGTVRRASSTLDGDNTVILHRSWMLLDTDVSWWVLCCPGCVHSTRGVPRGSTLFLHATQKPGYAILLPPTQSTTVRRALKMRHRRVVMGSVGIAELGSFWRSLSVRRDVRAISQIVSWKK